MASNPTASLGTAVLPVERKMDRWEPGPGWACPGCPLSTPEVRGWPVKGMEAGWPAGEADQQGQSALVQLEQEDTRGQRPPSLLTLIHGGGLQRGGRAHIVQENVQKVQAVQENVQKVQAVQENVRKVQAVQENVRKVQAVQENVQKVQAVQENVQKVQAVQENVQKVQAVQENVQKVQAVQENVRKVQAVQENVQKVQAVQSVESWDYRRTNQRLRNLLQPIRMRSGANEVQMTSPVRTGAVRQSHRELQGPIRGHEICFNQSECVQVQMRCNWRTAPVRTGDVRL